LNPTIGKILLKIHFFVNVLLCKFDYQSSVLDFSGEWRVVDYRDLVLNDCGIDVLAYLEKDDLLAEIGRSGINLGEVAKDISLGGLIDKLYKKVSRPKLTQPTFLVHHPSILIPLARRNDQNPLVVDSFQVLVNGWEMVKAYSELADPVLQANLLNEQASLRKSGDSEAMFFDDAFVKSLEYGMPPCSGVGLGIDRFTAILTNQRNLTDVVFFPLMR
jgi:lysyl-tRNA synthetase class 2